MNTQYQAASHHYRYVTLYLDWFNNYLSIGVFAEHNNISYKTAKKLIQLGKFLHEDYVDSLAIV